MAVSLFVLPHPRGLCVHPSHPRTTALNSKLASCAAKAARISLPMAAVDRWSLVRKTEAPARERHRTTDRESSAIVADGRCRSSLPIVADGRCRSLPMAVADRCRWPLPIVADGRCRSSQSTRIAPSPPTRGSNSHTGRCSASLLCCDVCDGDIVCIAQAPWSSHQRMPPRYCSLPSRRQYSASSALEVCPHASRCILIFRALALCASFETKKKITDRFLHAVFSDP